MALQGTHIRFARDLQDVLAVSDLHAYISGTIYPDSRYFTGVDRALTHPKELVDDFLRADDFKKGWAVHMICDRVQREIVAQYHPEIFEKHDEQQYVCITACKILQDVRDTEHFDVSRFADAIKVVALANDESYEKLQNFYTRIHTVYKDGGQKTTDQLLKMFDALGDFGDVVSKIRSQCETYERTGEIETMLRVIYPEMLARARKLI